MAEDPGWQRAVKIGIVGFAVIPMLVPRGALKVGDGLVTLRTVWVSTLTTDVVGLAVGLVLAPMLKPAVPTVAAVLGVVVVASLGVATLTQLQRPQKVGAPVADRTPSQVATAFRTRWFLRLAIASGVALLGFVAAVVSASLIPLAIGMAAGVAELIRMSPTAAHLAREQEELRRQGSTVELVPALRAAGVRS